MTSTVSKSLNKVLIVMAMVVKAEAEEEDVRHNFWEVSMIILFGKESIKTEVEERQVVTTAPAVVAE